MRAAIVSVAGLELTAAEKRLFAEHRPAGVILFRRNCANRRQLSGLTMAIRDAMGDDRVPVLIDQEGGRVARLRPPEWSVLPGMGEIGALAVVDRAAGRRAAALAGQLIAADLCEVGIDVACAPVLDVVRPDATSAIGDRAFGSEPLLVAELGRVLAQALQEGGVLPVMKHLPGHGAARTDSHLGLPVVELSIPTLRETDWAPFQSCCDLPLAMTAHVVYSAIDPTLPATTSGRVIAEIIRGEIGFSGVLLSDDLGMGALSGSLADRAATAIGAGCDIALYCGGRLEESAAVLAAVPELAAPLVDRLRSAARDQNIADMSMNSARGRVELGRLLGRG